MKFNSANSTFKIMCTGVPVINSRRGEIKEQTIKNTFLIWCASSMTIYSKLNFLKADLSMRWLVMLVFFFGPGEDNDVHVRSRW